MDKKTPVERIIMGIDPGTTVTGYGIILITGSQMSLITYGVIDLAKFGMDHPAKLRRIFERTLSLIDEFHPDELAIEAPFHGKNVQSMLKLGRAQGVAMAAALYRDIPIVEYAPKKVKMSITGRGASSKEQVFSMLEKLFKMEFDPKSTPLDATDGIAVAVCHFFQRGIGGGGNKTSVKSQNSWKSFVADNPGRVK